MELKGILRILLLKTIEDMLPLMNKRMTWNQVTKKGFKQCKIIIKRKWKEKDWTIKQRWKLIKQDLMS